MLNSTDCKELSEALRCDDSPSVGEPLTGLQLHADDVLGYVEIELPRLSALAPGEQNVDSVSKISVREDGIRIFGADDYLRLEGMSQTTEEKTSPSVLPCAKMPCTQLNDFAWSELSAKLSTIKKAAKQAGLQSQRLHIWTADSLPAEILLNTLVLFNDEPEDPFFPVTLVAVGADPAGYVKN